MFSQVSVHPRGAPRSLLGRGHPVSGPKSLLGGGKVALFRGKGYSPTVSRASAPKEPASVTPFTFSCRRTIDFTHSIRCTFSQVFVCSGGGVGTRSGPSPSPRFPEGFA